MCQNLYVFTSHIYYNSFLTEGNRNCLKISVSQFPIIPIIPTVTHYVFLEWNSETPYFCAELKISYKQNYKVQTAHTLQFNKISEVHFGVSFGIKTHCIPNLIIKHIIF